ncbi:MAG TPA: lamin tail domain-containing protein, partial [Chitinispirillaceae bacterium]|nr:lamin tail domain-containing protein [Chitinispirillaceae bacterium]
MTNLLFFQKLLLMLTALSIIIITTGCVDDSVPHEELNQDLLALRLTEIHYHPLALEGFTDDSLEFLEIKNIGSSQLNLDKLQFTLGITFLFPSGCKIAPNDFFVIASNNNAFKLRYGFYPDGEYSGQLKNSGETIELTDAASRNVIFSQTYSDSGSWPGSADGDGYSLVPVNLNPGKDETDSESWRPSTNIHGSPGADDVLKTVDSSLFNLRITEINYHPECADTTIEDSLEFIEIKNVGEKTLNLSGVAIDSAVEFKFDSSAGIKPGAFLILASNVKWFRQYYGFEPFGAFKGQLKNSGETILVRDRKAAIELFRISYRDRNPWPS